MGLFMSVGACGEIITETISYQMHGQNFGGYLAYDEKRGKRPGILIVHEWWGHNDYVRERAEQLAREGYTALALDMYGVGKKADHPDEAAGLMQAVLNDMPAAEQRFDKAYELLNNHKATRKNCIAALGYCFGGAMVLHMARLGAPLKAVVSYHGALGSKLADGRKPDIRGKIQVYTGGADPMISAEQVAAFTREMFEAGADFSLQVYKGARHSFTNPGADAKAGQFAMPAAYDKAADQDSWQKTLALLKTL